MNIFFLFRSDLRQLESYHKYYNLEDFEKNCWDFYLLQLLWLLKNNFLDEVVVWRLNPKMKNKDIIFNVGDKQFIQRWVDDFSNCINYKKPTTSFWRGGFECYDKVTKKYPDFFGKKLYLAAGKRITPKWGGIYDKILVESEKDIMEKTGPFYKTSNPNIFYPIDKEKMYDLIWVCHGSQISQKGQKFFINEISKSKFLKTLNILHVGNKPEVGIKLCKEYNVSNIEFLGSFSRPELNKCINLSKFGIVTSNKSDGCPRVITEIMCTGTPLIIRKETRLLNYYKDSGVIEFSDDEIEKKIKFAFDNYDKLKKEAIDNIENKLRMDNICKMNLLVWNSPEP